MKNQLIILSAVTSFFFASLSYAQDSTEIDSDSKRTEKLQEIKTEILASLNEEKAVIEQEISCVKSAQKGEDMRKCRETKRASMDQIREKNKQNRDARKQERRQKLQEEIGKIDQEDKDSK
jgi:hypothetical protein